MKGDDGEIEKVSAEVTVIDGKGGYLIPGIIDSHRLMAYLEAKAKNQGVNIVYKTRVERVEKLDEGKYALHIINPDGERFSYTTRYLITVTLSIARQGITTNTNTLASVSPVA